MVVEVVMEVVVEVVVPCQDLLLLDMRLCSQA